MWSNAPCIHTKSRPSRSASRKAPMSEVGCAGILVEDTFCGPLRQNPPAGQLVAVDRLGCVGRDAAGAFLKNSLATQGVGCSQLIEVDSEATSKTVILLVEGED